jgi:hypothetical protein
LNEKNLGEVAQQLRDLTQEKAQMISGIMKKEILVKFALNSSDLKAKTVVLVLHLKTQLEKPTKLLNKKDIFKENQE